MMDLALWRAMLVPNTWETGSKEKKKAKDRSAQTTIPNIMGTSGTTKDTDKASIETVMASRIKERTNMVKDMVKVSLPSAMGISLKVSLRKIS